MSFRCGSVDREPGYHARCTGFSPQQGISGTPVAQDRSHSSIGGGRGEEIKSSGSSLATREVQDSLGYMKLYLKEGGWGAVLAKGPLSCWAHRNYSASFLGIPVWPTERAWYPGRA